jgi:hypothetical protein
METRVSTSDAENIFFPFWEIALMTEISPFSCLLLEALERA